MDGTLLNSKREIHEENIKAIKRAQGLGVQTVISTGREYDNAGVAKAIYKALNLEV